MPIDYRNYHPSWKRISRFVRLIRAGSRCEGCGVRNYSVGHWERGKWKPMVGNLLLDFLGRGDATYKQARQWVWERKLMGTSEDDEYPVSVIVLTVAHLDHDVQNNDLENLKCLCQRCHLNHDRRDNIRRRRYGRKGQFYGQLTIQL